MKMYVFCLQRHFTGDCKIPVLIVGNKADKGTPVRQDFSLQPEAFCARYKVKYTKEGFGTNFIVILKLAK